MFKAKNVNGVTGFFSIISIHCMSQDIIHTNSWEQSSMSFFYTHDHKDLKTKTISSSRKAHCTAYSQSCNCFGSTKDQ